MMKYLNGSVCTDPLPPSALGGQKKLITIAAISATDVIRATFLKC